MKIDIGQLMGALSLLEKACREKSLPADEHDKLKAAVQVLFNHIKILEEEAKKSKEEPA